MEVGLGETRTDHTPVWGMREGCRHPHWDPSTEEMVENEPRESPVSASFLKKEWLSHLKSRAVLVPRPSSPPPPPPHYPHSRKLHPPLLHSWKLDLLLSILHPPATSHPNLEEHNPRNPSHSISTEPSAHPYAIPSAGIIPPRSALAVTQPGTPPGAEGSCPSAQVTKSALRSLLRQRDFRRSPHHRCHPSACCPGKP